MRLRRRLPFLVAALFVIAGVGWWYYSSTANRRGEIHLFGNIEVTETDVSFKVRGTIVELPIEEGTWVKQGALLARLEDHDLKNAVALAEAELDVDQAKLNQLLAGSRPQEIKAALEQLNQAESDRELRRKDFERIKELYQQGLAPAATMDDTSAAFKIAEAAAARARELYDLVKAGPRKEEIDTARAQVGQAQVKLTLAKTQLGYATLNAPISGVVLVKNTEIGEVVSPGTPVVTMGDVDHPWLRAYVNETDLGRVKWGQPVTVTTDTYPGKVYHGKIGFISSEAEFTPKSVQTQKERVTLVYRIKAYLDNPNRELKPGMPADGVILLQPPAPSANAGH